MTDEEAAAGGRASSENKNLSGDSVVVGTLREPLALPRAFLDLVTLTSWAPLQALALMVASGFVQGAGLLMLVPLLGVIGQFGPRARSFSALRNTPTRPGHPGPGCSLPVGNHVLHPATSRR